MTPFWFTRWYVECQTGPTRDYTNAFDACIAAQQQARDGVACCIVVRKYRFWQLYSERIDVSYTPEEFA